MSKLTDKYVAQIRKETNARAVAVMIVGGDQDPGNTGYTVKAHPLIQNAVPDFLRGMANDIEKKL